MQNLDSGRSPSGCPTMSFSGNRDSLCSEERLYLLSSPVTVAVSMTYRLRRQ